MYNPDLTVRLFCFKFSLQSFNHPNKTDSTKTGPNTAMLKQILGTQINPFNNKKLIWFITPHTHADMSEGHEQERPNSKRSLAGDTRRPPLIPPTFNHHFQFPSQKQTRITELMTLGD
jgi:hypothetical protein